MNKTHYKVLGVMSGTSLDGIDLAYIHFSFDGDWQFELTCFDTVSYSKEWIDLLQNLVSFSKEELQNVDEKYTTYLAKTINHFIKNNNIQTIDAICSHGHTALHQPENGLTYQIGNQKELALLTNNKVVCDFRVQDVELGGQGAPLVPIGDKLLFSEYDFCLNLGGFANISFEENKQRIAYDICPVNIVLNHYVQRLGLKFDDKGSIASTGKIDSNLLETLNNLGFYKLEFPKSLGLEWVKKEIFPVIDSYSLEVKDILKTFVEHIALQILKEISTRDISSILITGGGAFNSYLINRMMDLTSNEIIIPDNDIINFKEAVIFGFLGVLKIRGEVNCLSSVTGAKHDHSSGIIYLP